jgi:outer membrane protein OmpA-like peptidoglycan-associated protein
MINFTLFRVKSSLALLALFFLSYSLIAQNKTRYKPKWYFGQSIGPNFNFYRGYTQRLNDNTFIPTPFQNGDGVKPYVSLFVEYVPNRKTGIMLNVAFDNRGGAFDEVMAPCDCPANLRTNLSYIAIEPSLKVKPFRGNFFVFGGPTILFNITKDFTYTQRFQPDVYSSFSRVRESLVGAQIGMGYDIPLSAPRNRTQIVLSPFASFHTDLGAAPRVNESWSIHTFRIGLALKMGAVKRAPKPAIQFIPVVPKVVAKEKILPNDVQFSVRAPKIIPPMHVVKEVLPLRNSVFFDKGSNEIPSRYHQISPSEAANFSEIKMLQTKPTYIEGNRSTRQMAVYHHILNIMGDRMRAFPKSTIDLVGSSHNNPAEGKLLAEKIKSYLIKTFGIDSSRITVTGRAFPIIPSEQKGGTKELDLLQEGDRRVDIMSTSEGIIEQVGNHPNTDMKHVDMVDNPRDPLDSHVIFTNLNASLLLKPWSVSLTDEKGVTQTFGPFSQDVVSVPGKTILGNNSYGNYTVIMAGITKDGNLVKKESFVSLRKGEEGAKVNGFRFSILFEFNQATTIASYTDFLTNVVAPKITPNSTVIIHGHTDSIGDETHNQKLSEERAFNVQLILEKYVLNQNVSQVKFESFGFGEQEPFSPFNNLYPEERFYNRCVIIDIVPPIE